MADFARWACAAEPGLGWSKGTVLRAYRENREAANDLALEASPVVPVLTSLMAEQSTWRGTSGELLKRLSEHADEQTKRLKSWPASPQTLSNQLRRLTPNLRQAGLRLEFDREKNRKRARLVRIEKVGAEPSEASEASERQAEGGDSVDDLDGHNRAPDALAAPMHPTGRARNSRELDGVDDLDGSMLPFSDQPEEVIDLVD